MFAPVPSSPHPPFSTGTTLPPHAPVPHFSGTPLTGNAPLSVIFTDQSTNGPTSWLWNFGDGQTSTGQNPVHIYTTIGSYTVQLTATNAQGSASLTKTNYISIVGTSATIAPIVGGGIPYPGQPPRTKRDIIHARERFGIPDEERLKAGRIIREIARRQANALERDSQKRFDELARELELQGIGWDTRHLDALNQIRERLIDEEIKRLFDIERDALAARNKTALTAMTVALAELEADELDDFERQISANAAQMVPALLAIAQILGILQEAFSAKLQEDAAAPEQKKNAAKDTMKAQAKEIEQATEEMQLKLLQGVLESAKIILARHLEVTLY